MTLYEISAEALTDLLEIWAHIAADSVDLADRLDAEFHSLFESLGRMPGQGHTRTDLTGMPVRFFPLYSYLVIYRSDTKPIRIIAVLRGRRDLKHILRKRT
jgi:plasmid stabilization system protein ParE